MKNLKCMAALFIGLMVLPQTTEAQLFKGLKKDLKELKELFKGDEKEEQKEGEKSVKSDDEVTLTVSADGTTKDEAIKVALRSAIEQAYGTFVSTNTTILNDEMVKDEIVTVASGNIKSYKEIASNTLPDGKFYVTLQATVCISKLVSYAQSKGAETEFAGAAFGMNMKMKELNKQNEEIALKNMCEQVIAMYPSAFSYKIAVAEPVLLDTYPMKHGEIIPTEKFGLSGDWMDYYKSAFTISIEPNQNMEAIENLIVNTLGALALSEEEKEEYKKLNMKTFSISVLDLNDWYLVSDRDKKRRMLFDVIGSGVIALRSNKAQHILLDLNVAIGKILHNFEIVDNLNGSSKIEQWEIKSVGDWIKFVAQTGTGFFKSWPLLDYNPYSRYFEVFHRSIGINLFAYPGTSRDSIEFLKIPIYIRKADISKYAKFEVKPLNNEINVDDEYIERRKKRL